MVITRRNLLKASTALVGSIIAYAVFGSEPVPLASQLCTKTSFTNEIPRSAKCRVQFGPPSCAESCITVYSPNDYIELYNCCWECSTMDCNCAPKYIQARGAACNSGKCSCTRRVIS